jgi:microcystin-dependent protein
LSTTYGTGDGSTTFTLPNYQGYFLRGWNNSAGNDPDAASRTNRGDGTTGDSVGTIEGSQFGAHSHSIYRTVTTSGGEYAVSGNYSN